MFFRSGKDIRIFISIALMLFLAVGAVAESDLNELVKKIQPSVFTIIAYDQGDEILRRGSGFFIDPNGQALTNYHLLEGAHRAEIKANNGNIYPVKYVLGEVRSDDIVKVLISLPGKPVPHLKISKAPREIGERIVVVEGLRDSKQTASEGIISAIGRKSYFENIYQISTSLTQESCGGPVVNMAGEAIGMASIQVSGGQSQNFAISFVTNLGLMEFRARALIRTGQYKPKTVAEWTAVSEESQAQIEMDGIHSESYFGLSLSLDELRNKAEAGDSGSQVQLGNRYAEGKGGVERDYLEAAKWYHMAKQGYSAVEDLRKKAEAGDAESQYKLGNLYAKEGGVKLDYKEAAKWYQKSAEQGHADAQYSLGMMYLKDQGVKIDGKEALNWLYKAAIQGNAAAQEALGFMYQFGIEVDKDDGEAFKWYRKAAEQGYASAQYILGFMYYYGLGVDKEFEEAAKWYRKSAEQGHAEAQYNLGLMYNQGRGVEQDYKEVIKWFQNAAEQDNADAQYDLGWMYSQGRGVDQDYKEAVKWCRKAAEQGVVHAQYSLGIAYRQGEGVEQDYKESVKWYRKAAEQRNSSAQYSLGMMYYIGLGVEQDYKEAAKWFLMASEQGDANAQYCIGLMYDNGQGVIEDYVEAYKWYLLAGMNGEDVKRLKEDLQQKMTASQIAEAQRRAKEFVARKETKADQSEESGAIKTTGTGFFISEKGYLLTSRHVIEDAKKVEIVTSTGIYPATIIHTDSSTDVAILKVESQRFRTLPLVTSQNVKTGDKVFTIGFPNIGLQGFEPKYTEGVISSLSGAIDDPRYFQISTPVQPGNSGGPLINEHGEVVGIITARLSEASSLATTGVLPQNVNYALKSSYVRAFLEAVPKAMEQSLEKSEQSASDRSEQIQHAQEAVALILSYY